MRCYAGVCPTVVLYVLWDVPHGVKDARKLAAAHELRFGTINANIFQDQTYKNGLLGNPDPEIQIIEQIVVRLLDLEMLGGFRFNDRRYADDGIDPYQVFRIFTEFSSSKEKRASTPISPT